jgi:serine protease AprX
VAVLACVALGLGAAAPAEAAAPAGHKPLKELLTGGLIGDTEWGDNSSSATRGSLTGTGDWAAEKDLGSLSSITADYGIQAAWARGVTGKGVTVAVIDTGIAPVPGLDGSGKVVNGPDLSFDGQAPGTRYVDGYGHGTHMAAIIAGRDEKLDPKKPDPALFGGVAPDAQLLNMKVGAADGGADVSQVIAALDWVVAHRRDHGMNVRVVNLAYGTASVQAWQVDPLARAVENAWNAGLVVVTAAGNDGLAAPSLLMPAVDPHVLAVGAVDHAGTVSKNDDVVADFTNGGSAARRPDVLAPGKSVVSLRVPGSYVDTQHPEGLVVGDASKRFFRGSGTSQATAVTSGEVALLLQARPTLTPDQVKAVLRSSADPLTTPNPAMGAGVTDLPGALLTLAPLFGAARLPDSTGTGSLEASRGGEHVLDPSDGGVLAGEVDALGTPWDGAAWVAASTRGTAWAGGSWNGRAWAGTKWAKDSWGAAAWTGDSWSGTPWEAHVWSDAAWEARSWRDSSWEARSWREESWLARSWRDEGWSARSWRSLE